MIKQIKITDKDLEREKARINKQFKMLFGLHPYTHYSGWEE